MSKINSVYLAYPIDQSSRQFASLASLYDAINWFKGMVAAQVSWVFDPGDAFAVNPYRQIDPGLALINRAALNNADAVVAFLPAGIPSIGVPMEIDRARAQGKIVMVFTDTNSYMLAMRGVAQFEGWEQTTLDAGFIWLLDQEVYDPGHPGYFGEIRWTGEPQFEPVRAYDDDAGYDLIVSEDLKIPGRTFLDIPCGVSVELPERTWGLITGRSSTLRKRGLLVHPGIIDTGYRGPLFAAVYNMGDDTVYVREGERLAQLILFNNSTMRYPMMRVDELGPSERGVNGFGSTGA